MKMIKLIEEIEFVRGSLVGLTHTNETKYPESSKDRLISETDEFVKTGRVIESFCGSDYKITGYRIEPVDF